MASDQKGTDTSVLAEHLKDAYSKLKQGPSRGTILILGFLVLAIVLFFVWRYFSAASRDAASDRWVKLDGILFPEQLNTFLDEKDVKGTVPGRVARYKEARRLIHNGLRNLGRLETRTRALKDLSEGADLYESLLKESPTPALKQEALWSIAKAAESLAVGQEKGSREQLDRAKATYQDLAREFPDSGLGKEAKTQLEYLESDKARKELPLLRAKLSRPEGE